MGPCELLLDLGAVRPEEGEPFGLARGTDPEQAAYSRMRAIGIPVARSLVRKSTQPTSEGL